MDFSLGERLANPVPRAEALPEGLRTFEGFFRIEYPRLVRSLYLLIGNPEEAEDVAQAAMVRVLERWERVRRFESPEGYLYRVAFNLNRGRVRSVLRYVPVLRESVLNERDPAQIAEARGDVRRAIRSLPQRYREAIVLADWLGMDHREMGHALRTSTGNARVRLHRARQAFRRSLGEGYD